MKKFYAAHESVLTEIAVFNSKQERDEWINFKDWFSKEYQSESMEDKRIALSYSETLSLVGKTQLHNTGNYVDDNVLENVKWIISNPVCGGVSL